MGDTSYPTNENLIAALNRIQLPEAKYATERIAVLQRWFDDAHAAVTALTRERDELKVSVESGAALNRSLATRLQLSEAECGAAATILDCPYVTQTAQQYVPSALAEYRVAEDARAANGGDNT